MCVSSDAKEGRSGRQSRRCHLLEGEAVHRTKTGRASGAVKR